MTPNKSSISGLSLHPSLSSLSLNSTTSSREKWSISMSFFWDCTQTNQKKILRKSLVKPRSRSKESLNHQSPCKVHRIGMSPTHSLPAPCDLLSRIDLTSLMITETLYTKNSPKTSANIIRKSLPFDKAIRK